MRVYKWSTVDGVFYAYADGTQATEAEWDAQCRRIADMHAERERKERERKAGQVYSDEPVRYRMGRQGGYSVDAHGFANNGLIFR